MKTLLPHFLILSVSSLLVGCGETPADEAQSKSEEKAVAPKEAEVTTAEPGQQATGDASGFAAIAAAKVGDGVNVQGDDNAWFFLNRELKQMALGAFWEGDWAGVAANGTDPIPSMVEFNNLLKEKGIELIAVPVPAKASIYPDKLDASAKPSDPIALSPIIERLKSEGVNAIDFEKIAREYRAANPDVKLWCEQDAHYTPTTAKMIAELVAKEIGDKVAGTGSFTRAAETEIEIVGDQIKGSDWEGNVAKEKLKVEIVDGVEPDPESPVLLIGDSHTLVFQEGGSNGMHCKGAGVFDQLAAELKLAPDLVGVRGSGLVQARKQLFFHAKEHPGYWEKKKVVVWIFSVREFTQSSDKIIKIPLEK